LTHKGRQIAEKINQFEDAKVDSILESLSEQEQNLFTHALSEALDILVPDKQPVFLIRTHKAGDLGMITHFHGKYYADKYGYSNVFEALVAKDFSDYILNFEEGKDIFYVVEKDGVVMGSLALQHRTDVSAQLRFFYLDSSLRGIGLGKKLMNYILSFARKTGYTHLDLWTHENLKSAHSIYKKAGFKIVERKVHSLWKENLEEQRWELYL
jgi:GNAT superfamily N-acetyltransferase